MHPVHDFDALLILATALASKRRPAELSEIMAAMDLLHAGIPAVEKIAEAFERLSRHGLICAAGEGFSLSIAAQALVVPPKKKVDHDERLFQIKEQLEAFKVQAECAAVLLTLDELAAAIRQHRASGEGAGKNLLVPKPKPEAQKARPGQRQRKPLPARRRKD